MEKKLINEKITKTKKGSLKRIYLDGLVFLNTKFKIGSKFSYEIDFANKSVKIVPATTNFNGTISKKIKKNKGESVFVPVFDINNKNIESVFSGINKCKVSIYEDEIFIEAIEEITSTNVVISGTDNEETSNSNNVISIFQKKKAVKKVYKVSKQQLDTLLCQKVSGLNETSSVFDSEYSFYADSFTQYARRTSSVQSDLPTLDKTLKVFSLFSGVGAFEKALTNLGVNYDLVGFSEVDKYASKAFCALHEVNDESLNYGDICKIDEKMLPDFKLLVGGSPCQQFSIMNAIKTRKEDTAGLKGEESKLFFDYVRILNHKKPDHFIFENVQNIMRTNNGRDFEIMLSLLGEHYNIKYKLLDSKDYGIPQTRRRVFIVGQLKSLGNFNFEFPEPIKLTKTVFDSILEDKVDDKYYLTERLYKTVMSTGTKNWCANPETDLPIARPLGAGMAKMRRASQDNYYHTDYKPQGKTNLRRLIPLEAFKLQGFSVEDFKKVVAAGISDTQMYRLMGNSITVNVLSAIFKNLIPRRFFSNVIHLY